MYLYFVLLYELEHFGLLRQYFRPIGSWSAAHHSKIPEVHEHWKCYGARGQERDDKHCKDFENLEHKNLGDHEQ